MAASTSFQYLIAPIALAQLALRFLPLVSLGERLLLSLVAVTAHFYLRLYLTGRSERIRAAALGARPFPRLRTPWPLNLGVLAKTAYLVDTEEPFTTFVSQIPPGELTVDMRFFGGSDLFTMDDRVIQHILVDDFANYVKGDIFTDGVRPVCGTTLLTMDLHSGWKQARARYKPFLTLTETRNLDRFSSHVDRLLDIIADKRGETFEIGHVLSRYFLDVAVQWLTCKNMDSQSSDPVNAKRGERFLKNFDLAMTISGRRLLAGPLWHISEPNGPRLVAQTNAELDKIIYPFIDEIIDDAEKGNKTASLCHAYTDFYDRPGLRNILIAGIIATHDTLTGTVTSLFYELARHPEVVEEARRAVLARITDSREPTLEDIKALPILRAIFDETTRLHPAGAANGREAVKDNFVMIEGERRFIPAGTMVAFSIWHLQRRKDLWGEDAEEWKPSRWLQGPKGTVVSPAPPGAWQPFHAGPRLCMGIDFAYNQALYLLVRVLQRFDRIEPAWSPEKKPSHIIGFTLQMKNGVTIRMREAPV